MPWLLLTVSLFVLSDVCPLLPPYLLSLQEIAEGDQVGVRTAREASQSLFPLLLSRVQLGSVLHAFFILP